MGYSRSIRSLRRVQPHLELMSRSEKDIEIPSEDATKLSRWLYEGINYCRAKLQDPATSDDMKELCSRYASLRSKFIIKVIRNKVYCELRDGTTPLPKNAKEAVGHAFMHAHGITESLEAIGYMIEHSGTDIHFVDYSDFDDLASVYQFATSKGYFIINQQLTKNGILVTMSPEYQELAWKPESL